MPSTKTSLEELIDRIHEVSSLPHVVTQVIAVVDDASASAGDLKCVVESDPALAARVLRTVNSAAYGIRVRVDTIHRAICLLGFNEVRKLTVTASVAEMFKDQSKVGAYDRQGLWRHLVSVAVVSRMIAMRSGIRNFDQAFLCGLLHDVGIVLIDQHVHEEFTTIVARLSTGQALVPVEQEVLGFDHMGIGAELASRWRFPECVIEAIRFHHRSERCKSEHGLLVGAVEVANCLCARKNITSMGIGGVEAPAPATFSALSIGREDLKIIWEDLDQELERNKGLIEI